MRLMKWIIAIGLTVALPFFGIPLLFFLLWKNEDYRRWSDFTKSVSKQITGPFRSDYHSDEAYRSAVELEVIRLEQLWQSRKLFKSIQVEKFNNGNVLEIDEKI